MFVEARRRHLGRDGAARQDQHAVADIRELLGVGTGAQDGGAALGGISDGAENGAPCPDIDPLRRLVQQQQPRSELQPLSQDDLLLVAAAQRR